MEPEPAIFALSRARIGRGTESSNPAPSREESANFRSPLRNMAWPQSICATKRAGLNRRSVPVMIAMPVAENQPVEPLGLDAEQAEIWPFRILSLLASFIKTH